MLTIIIPFYNGHQYIDNLLKSIPDDQPVIIVDDVSDTPYKLNRPNTKLFRLDKKGFFAGAVNFGIQQCDTDVLILNQDSILSNGWQESIDNHKYAMIGERIKGNHPLFPHGYIHGTFMFIRRDLINDIGLLNEQVYPLWGNTAEYQLRASRKGYKVLPLSNVPGFNHLREENKNYGSSITQLLKNEPQAKKTLINTPPEISVIIPCHNYAHYLPDSINSLIGGETCIGRLPGQTFQSFEIIIVDDGSNKENQEKINSFVDGWNGIRVVRLDRNPVDDNGKYIGKPSALNIGISKAIGKYITVLDCDDMMDSRRLQNLYNAMEQNPNSIVYDQLLSFKQNKSNTVSEWEARNKHNKYIDTSELSLEQETVSLTKLACENYKTVAIGNRLTFRFWKLPDYDFEQLINKNCMHSGIIFSKKAWQDVGGYNEKMIYGREDWCINIAFGQAGYCGIKLEQPFYLYRREGQNRTLENTKPNWQRKFIQQIQEIYADLFKGYRPMACCGRGAKSRTMTNNKIQSLGQTSEGLTYIKYVGVRTASFSVWGASTGHQYRVNPKNPVFLVEEQDLSSVGKHAGLLDMYEGTKYMFQQYTPPQPKKEQIKVVEIKPVVEEETTVENKVIPEPEFPTRLLDALHNLTKLKSFLMTESYTLEELNLMLEHEKENKQRKTAIDMLEENIDQYDGSNLFDTGDV